MAFGSMDPQDAPALSDINMVPFIDVMLVLLIIFMVTAPMLTHAVKVELPKASSEKNQQAQAVQLAIDAAQGLHWNGERVDEASLSRLMANAGASGNPPEVQLRVDRSVPYDAVAKVMAMAARHKLNRLGFVMEPGRDR